MYPIIQAPNEVLRRASVPVNFSGPKLEKIIAQMTETLVKQKDPEGIGLAANQIGLPYRLFLARFGTEKNEPIHVFINPEILKHSEETQEPKGKNAQLEGCLSLPRYYGPVKRWKSITVKYLNEKFEMRNEKFEDFPAVVIQHEMDHLEGKIFVERILEQKGKLYRVSGKNNKDEDTWEEVEL